MKNQPTFLTIEYKGYFILTDSMSPEVRIASDVYGIIGRAKTIRGAKIKISNMIKGA